MGACGILNRYIQDGNRWTDGSGNVLPDAFLLRDGAIPRDLAYAYHHAVGGRTKQRIGNDTELEEGDVMKVVTT